MRDNRPTTVQETISELMGFLFFVFPHICKVRPVNFRTAEFFSRGSPSCGFFEITLLCPELKQISTPAVNRTFHKTSLCTLHLICTTQNSTNFSTSLKIVRCST